MASIKDVARHANVSIMTVSRVINHPHLVREDLQALVKASMSELDYTPNRAARALVSKHTGIIQVVIHEKLNKTDPYALTLLNGISIGLSQRHYSLLILPEYNSNIACDGVIITGMTKKEAPIYTTIQKPVVSFGHNNFSIPFVDIDNFTGQQVITQLCLEKGAARIAYFGIQTASPYAKEREFGFNSATKSRKVIVSKHKMLNSHEKSYEKALEILPVFQPDAIVCASDMLALGVIHACQQLNFEIPKDVMITGFDGVFIDEVTRPKLTTVKQPLFEMGQSLASKLIDLIDGKSVELETFFEPTVLKNETTK